MSKSGSLQALQYMFKLKSHPKDTDVMNQPENIENSINASRRHPMPRLPQPSCKPEGLIAQIWHWPHKLFEQKVCERDREKVVSHRTCYCHCCCYSDRIIGRVSYACFVYLFDFFFFFKPKRKTTHVRFDVSRLSALLLLRSVTREDRLDFIPGPWCHISQQ